MVFVMFIALISPVSSYRNTSESLGEQEMLWEHKQHVFLFLLENTSRKKRELFTLTIKMYILFPLVIITSSARASSNF